MRLSILVLILFTLAICACQQRHSQAVHEALNSLKKVQAASQIGTTYEQFSGLVIDAKVKTNDALNDLPEGELRDAINGAIDCYADATWVWQMKINRQPLKLYGPTRELLMKYSIQVKDQGSVEAAADPDAALTEILKRGNAQVALADSLLETS